MDWTQFYSILWRCVGVLLTGLTSYGLTVLLKWLNSKIKDEKLRSYMNQIATIISNAVLATEQTYVSTIKSSGTWTTETSKIALEKALETAKSQLTTELTTWITENEGDVTTYLTLLIEAQIGALKATTTTSTTTTTTESGS